MEVQLFSWEDFALRGEFLFHVEKEPKDARGRAQSAGSAKPPCLHAALPLEPPLRGTRTCWIFQRFRRKKFECLVQIFAGPLGPGCSKIAVDAILVLRLALPNR